MMTPMVYSSFWGSSYRGRGVGIESLLRILNVPAAVLGLVLAAVLVIIITATTGS